jgi:hypothetical protein
VEDVSAHQSRQGGVTDTQQRSGDIAGKRLQTVDGL